MEEQISNAVQPLHKRGIVWGDAKQDNILIKNANSEATLIGFNGTAQQTGLDEHLDDTKEVDLQPLERILRYIDKKHTSVDGCYLCYRFFVRHYDEIATYAALSILPVSWSRHFPFSSVVSHSVT